MRRLLYALALTLAFASPAFAQSDARKVAIFYSQGDEAQLVHRTTGQTGSAKPYSETMTDAMNALEDMGVPYQVFTLEDSASWWKLLGESGASRIGMSAASLPDSVRFRAAGFFGCLMVMTGADNSYPFFKNFQDGRQKGSYLCSPLSGRWGIPTICWTDGLENTAGYPIYNGALLISVGTTSPTGVSYIRHGFKKSTTDFGDTLDVGRSLKWQVQVGQIDSVDVLIRSDSLGLTGSQGGRMSAWKWKASTYYYPTGSAGTSIWTLLGINQLFVAAGYTPRRKLNLHMTLDHPYPESFTDTAPSDSAWRYINTNRWRFSGAMKADGIARTNQNAAMAEFWRTRMKTLAIPCYPHSHTTGIGNYFQATSWNLTTWADTSLKRQRWNWMESSIADTMGLTIAKGYEKTIGFPGDGVYYPDLYIFAQNKYTDIRSFGSDSLGSQSGAAYNHVYSGPATANKSSAFPNEPYPYIEATSGRTVWVHDLYTHPDASATNWAGVGSTFSNDIDGKNHAFQSAFTKSILYDADFYWHPNENLQNATGTEMPMSIFLRRMTYILGRLSRIVTVQPSYLNKTPRRTSIARG